MVVRPECETGKRLAGALPKVRTDHSPMRNVRVNKAERRQYTVIQNQGNAESTERVVNGHA